MGFALGLALDFAAGGDEEMALTPQQLGVFYVYDVVATANIANLASFNSNLYFFPVPLAGDVILLIGQTDKKANGPYVCGTMTAGVCALTRHPDYADGSLQNSAMKFIATAAGSWVGLEFKSFGGTPYTTRAANFITVGTDNNPIYPSATLQYSHDSPWVLASGVVSQQNWVYMPYTSNNFGVSGTVLYTKILGANDALSVDYNLTITPAGAGIGSTIAITAKLANGSTNTADTSAFNLGIVNF